MVFLQSTPPAGTDQVGDQMLPVETPQDGFSPASGQARVSPEPLFLLYADLTRENQKPHQWWG